MFCRNCGSSVADQAVNCPNCGAPMQAVPPPPAQPVPQQYAQPPVYAQPPYTQMPPPTVKPKKRHGCLTAFIIVLVLILGAAAAVYFLLPGLFRPVDLGVKTTKEAYESAMTKLGYTKDEAPGTGQQDDYNYVYGPVAPVSISMNSEEVTSFMNYNRPSYFPLKNVQVKIGGSSSLQNGSTVAGPVQLSVIPVSSAGGDAPIEVSGTIDRDYAINYLLKGNYSQGEIEDALKEIGIDKLLPAKVNLYLKMSGRIENNKIVGLQLYEASVLGVAIPDEYVNSSDAYNIVGGAIDMLLADFSERSGAYFVSIKTADGEMIIDGQVPSSLTRTPKG